jgi:signal transduction histidine kinase
VILGFVRVLKDRMLGDLNGEQEKALLTVNRHATDLLAMVDNIMDATLIQAGKVETSIQPVDLTSVLTSLRQAIELPPDKTLTLAWTMPESLPTLLTDETKLRFILRQLIDNAVKFTEAGSVAFTVRHEVADQRVAFSVADTGVGMPASALEQIFELFHQVDGTKTRAFGGMGLGLYIVKRLTSFLGGDVTVDSKPGAGSVFTLSLPLVPAQRPDTDPNHVTRFFQSPSIVQDL